LRKLAPHVFGDSFPSTDVTVRSAAKASCRSDCLASASD
jgi:hypothetical protein